MNWAWGPNCALPGCRFQSGDTHEFGAKCEQCGLLFCMMEHKQLFEERVPLHKHLCAPTWEERMQKWLEYGSNYATLDPCLVFSWSLKCYIHVCSICGKRERDRGHGVYRDASRCAACVQSFRCSVTKRIITYQKDYCNSVLSREMFFIKKYATHLPRLPKDIWKMLWYYFIKCRHS